MQRGVFTCLALLVALTPTATRAQTPQPQPPQGQSPQAEAPQNPPVQAPPADPGTQSASPDGASGQVGAPAQTAAPEAGATAAPPSTPPLVALIPVPSRRARLVEPVPDQLTRAVHQALIPLVRRRPVRILADEERLAAIATCEEPTCVGAQLAELGAVQGVLLRAERGRRRADPYRVVLEVVDPVSGAPRTPAVELPLTAEELEDPAAAIAPLVAQLADAMPRPPPRTTLLVAINVDGAEVEVDDSPVGESPIGPIELTAGEHQVQIRRRGYLLQRRRVELAAGEQGRLDVDLTADPSMMAEEPEPATGSEHFAATTSDGEGPLYTRWYVLAGGGVLVTALVVGIVLAASSSDEESGIPVPPIQ